MKHKSNQFPDPFVVRRIDSDIFKNPKELPSVDDSQSSDRIQWKTTRSFELRSASRQSSASNTTSKFVPLSSNRPQLSAKERLINGKLSKINRLINSIRSQYTADAWSARASSRQSNVSRLPIPSSSSKVNRKVSKSKYESKSESIKQDDSFHNTDFITGSLKPICHPPLVENPYRQRFNNQYEKAYRQLFK